MLAIKLKATGEVHAAIGRWPTDLSYQLPHGGFSTLCGAVWIESTLEYKLLPLKRITCTLCLTAAVTEALDG